MSNKKPPFSISNKHVADSGQPPQFDGDMPDRYHGYFENAYGEQAVFVYDRQAGSGTLWLAAVGASPT